MQAGVFLFFVLIVYSANGHNSNPSNVTVVVVGRSGTGISSTVKEIIGRNKIRIPANGTPTLIQEFEVPIPGQQRYLKIVDVEGLVDGKTIEQDAETLSSLKFYLSNTSGLNGKLPNLFLVISNFEDNRIQGKRSDFTQMLNRVEMLQKSLYKDTTPTVFLLTKFMASTKTTQRRPQQKIELFNQTIREFTGFKTPIEIVVGENFGQDNGLVVENGYTKLPNKDIYPKNVFDKFISVTTSFRDLDGAYGIQDFVASRESAGEIVSQYYDNRNDDKDEFLKKLHILNSDVEDNEVNRAVQEAYDNLDVSTKGQAISDMIYLQTYFQSKSLIRINQLPKTALERVIFFQNLSGLNANKLILLKTAFGLSMPELIQHPVVGYGYDALQDISLQETPFLENSQNPSPIGYLIPEFLTCSKLSRSETVDFTYFSETVDDYLPLRSKFLDFQEGDKVSRNAFEGAVKYGFNLRPEESETVVSLSGVQETRTIECKLNDRIEMNQEFRDSVNALTPFNLSDRDSEVDWKAFFRKYGTHVVSRGYGGGYMEGSIASPNLKRVMTSNSEINQTLKGIINFGKFRFPEKPSYRFFGGDKDSRLENVYNLDSALREQLVQSWTNSLNYDPVILQNELKLTPISVYAKIVDETLGREVNKASRLLLNADLIYKRPVKNRNGTSNRQTPRPYIPSAEDIPSTEPAHAIRIHPTPPGYPDLPSSNTRKESSQYNNPQLSTDSISNPLVPPCMNQKNPTVPESSTIEPNPTNSPKKEVLRDYTAFTVGQSYHMLKELVLPKSPFNLFSNQPKYRNVIKSVNLTNSCELMNIHQFDTLKDYVESRLRQTFGIITIPPNVDKNYKGKVLPGNFIKEIQSNRRFRFEMERRFSQLKIDDTLRLNLETTDEFTRDLLALPYFQPLNPPDCNGKQMWKRFFDKFGTHFIKSTYLGYSYEVILNDVGDVKFPLKKQFGNCMPNYELNWWESNLKTINKDNVLKPTFEFISYSNLMRWNGTLIHSIDEAMYQLMANNLSCS